MFILMFLIRRLKLNQETGTSEMFSVDLEQSALKSITVAHAQVFFYVPPYCLKHYCLSKAKL